MDRKTILLYIIIYVLSFLFCFAFIQSIQFGTERIPISLIIFGKNIKGLNAFYNNKIVKNIPLSVTDSTNKKYILEVPVYAYIRNLKITVDYDKLMEIHKIELLGNDKKVTIKSSDIPNYFRYSNYLYNPKSKQFSQIESSKVLDNDKLVITSIDISNFTNELYIKRPSFPKTILYSIIISTLFTIVYYFLFLKNTSKVELKKVTLIVFIVILSGFTYSILNKKNTGKEDFSEKSIFEIIKPHTPNNLIYNGDFKYGLLFWGYDSDSTSHQIIDTPFGKGVKIKRGNGNGTFWSLKYLGRSIIYHENHTYKIKFKYKITKEEGIPFYIGWWIHKGKLGYGSAYNLEIKKKPLQNGWYDAEAYYTFQQDLKKITCLMNSLKDSSEVYVTDIQIYDLNRTENQIDFTDQINK